MNREQAIEILECRRAYYASLSTDPSPDVKATKVCGYTLADSANACLMAIEALEREPCEDAISRSETIKYLNTNMAWYDEDGEIADSDEKLKAITDLINGVPSVTPQQKMGRWKDIVAGNIAAQACDQCNTFYPLAYTGGGHKYCPNCGAKMQEEKNDC